MKVIQVVNQLFRITGQFNPPPPSQSTSLAPAVNQLLCDFLGYSHKKKDVWERGYRVYYDDCHRKPGPCSFPQLTILVLPRPPFSLPGLHISVRLRTTQMAAAHTLLEYDSVYFDTAKTAPLLLRRSIKPNDLNLHVRDSRSGNPEPWGSFVVEVFPVTLKKFSFHIFNLEVN